MRYSTVAVTGMGIACAAGSNLDAFSSNLWAGRSGIKAICDPAFAMYEHPVGGEIRERWPLEPLPGRDVAWFGRVARMAVRAIDEALEMSKVELAREDPARVGLVFGKCQGEPQGPDGSYMPVHAPSDAVGHYFGLRGPRVVISTACAAGTNAIGAAVDLLQDHVVDFAIAGGADALSAATYAGFEAAQALSSEPTAPYSRSKGLNLGEGAAFLVLERSDDAARRGVDILAEVLGYGLSADAYHATAPDPTGRGAALAMRRALREAEIGPEDVSYVNGHGTGTPANDGMERRVMRSVFGDRLSKVPISGIKPFVGHTLGAAGAVEAVACVLALQNDLLPPTLNFDRVEPDDEFDFVPNSTRPHPVKVAMSNSYAFGGNNASIVLAKPGLFGQRRQVRQREVHITGLGPIGAIGTGVASWRDAFTSGRTGTAPISSFDAAPYTCKTAAEVTNIDRSPLVSPADWRHMNSVARQAMVAVGLALEDSGVHLTRADREGAALIFGSGFGPASAGLAFASGPHPSVAAFSQVTLNSPAGEICRVLGFRGPTTTITSGAVSGSLAVATAADLIRRGRADFAVAVAVDEFFEHWLEQRLAVDPTGLSPTGVVRPYDVGRDGTALGSAAVAFVLEAPERAEERGARSYGKIRSSYFASDNYHHYRLDPTGEVFSRVIATALERAKVKPTELGYCASWACGHEHDEIEARALSSLLRGSVPVGAAKAMTGDCEAASGGVNVLTCCLALSEGFLTPTINLTEPLPGYDLDHVSNQPRHMQVDFALAVDAAYGATVSAFVIGSART